MAIKLTQASLAALPNTIERPRYDRRDMTPGIVHIGVGGFHRSHQALYLDEMFNRGGRLDCGIIGVGLMPGDLRIKRSLESQDYLYTLMVIYPNGERRARVVGSIVDYLYAPDDSNAVIEAMANSAIHTVSLTITEGGYNSDPVTEEFDFSPSAITADLDNPAQSKTVFGLVCEALRRRWQRNIVPFTVLSCDNIQGNGDIAKRMFCSFGARRDAALGAWMAANVAFPNSRVDRITPVTTDEDRDYLAQQFDIEDACPVVCEPYLQWVMEAAGADFPLSELASVGVQIVGDVKPYELMKLRLLNASHQALAYFAYLSGYRYVHEAAQDTDIKRFLGAYMAEAAPTLEPLAGVDVEDYCRTVILRFGNPYIADTLSRICTDSSERIPKFILPMVRDNIRRGGPVALAAAVVASWARYCEGVDEEGMPIQVVDPRSTELMHYAAQNRQNATVFIANRALFGELIDHQPFANAYRAVLASLHARGARATMAELLRA